ncbi:MAG: amidohydrolase [Candidatus Obscuribacterales bacterium]|nr:amidohydrolase [Candidatus Obscuribacterales bacterium]
MSNPQEMLEKAARLSEQIIEVRRRIHAAPELSFQEIQTSLLVKNRLEQLGFTVKTGIAKTGLIADFGTGKTIAIRSDMDALPGFESSRAAYVSQSPGVMHACGHDAHVAITLAAAELIAAQLSNSTKENKAAGRLRLIFQPGTEEAERDGNSSAKLLLEAGALADVSALLGLHVDATIETGRAGIITSQLNNQVSLFNIKVQADDQNSKAPDALPKANRLMTGLYKLAGEMTNRGVATITLGSCISSSQRGNIMSQQVLLSGTISSTSTESKNEAVEELEKLAARENGDGFSLMLEFNDMDSNYMQSASVIETLKHSAIQVLGEGKVADISRKTWASDFALLAGAAPAAFFYLGAQISGSRRIHHQPTFDLDETGLHLGAAILAHCALELMES